MKKNENDPILENQTIPEIYANIAKINFSPYEFEILFGLVSSNYNGIKPIINFRISPQFAKELAKHINENVEIYEKNISKIVTSKEN